MLTGVAGIVFFLTIGRSDLLRRFSERQQHWYIGWKKPDLDGVIAINRALATFGAITSAVVAIAGLIMMIRALIS